MAPAAVVRLVNSTPLGPVLTARALRAHRDAAGARIAGDPAGRMVDFLRYVAWLALEEIDAETRRRGDAEKQRAAGGLSAYEEKRRRQAEKNRAATRAAQDIGPIPEIKPAHLARRRAAEKSLQVFLETYFGPTFHRAWSPDHLRAIDRLQRAICRGGLLALAMPRGSGKTSLARCAVLWAVLTGRQGFACMIGGSRAKARELMAPLRKHLLENVPLGEDFPEAVFPFRRLENCSKRQLAQHIAGKLTHIHWGDEKLVFAAVADEQLPKALRGSAGFKPAPTGARPRHGRPLQKTCAEAVIAVTSLDANFRGPHHVRVDGSTVRPGLVVLDDPQTRQSARSPSLTRYRLELLGGDVLALAGPGQGIAAIVTCTKIYAGDLADHILDRSRSPEWQGEAMKLLYAMPDKIGLWEEYWELRCRDLAGGGEGRSATEFYRDRRAEMDAGAKPAWPDRYERPRELSALQNAMHLYFRDKQAFAAEYQNEPIIRQASEDRLTAKQAADKVNGRPRGAIPPDATRLTAFIDVHDRLLYWAVCAWGEQFTGYVVDYGTFPQQPRGWFCQRTARASLRAAFPGAGPDGAIQAGLERLVTELLARSFPRGAGQAGAILRIDRLLVDAAYKPGIVAAVKHLRGGAAMMLYRGVGLTAGRKPMASYQRRPGEIHGNNWYQPTVSGTRDFPHVAADVNYWKSRLHEAFLTAAGEPGSLTIFGRPDPRGGGPREHELLAEHLAESEFWTDTFGHGRAVREWRQRPSNPDNHWLDCLAGCMVGASMLGVAGRGMEAPPDQRRHYSQAALSRRAR